MLCSKCYGSGRVMGQGMMFQDCDCDEIDVELISSKEAAPVVIDKRSKSYREAISRIMGVNDCSREEATKVFEEEFYKTA